MEIHTHVRKTALQQLRDSFIEWRQRRMLKELARRKDEIISSFNVKEHHGELYLMHDGNPIKKIASDATATDIARMLETARDDAMHYDGLI